MADWGFYGRQEELRELRAILSRNRWFFVKVTGRRRIGKTTLIQQALRQADSKQVYYVQIPDSAPAGVLSAVADAMDTFEIPPEFTRPRTLPDFARVIGTLARAGYVVTLDEFQYFNRERLREFCSLLQTEIDGLSRDAAKVRGGLLVLGSIQTEISALLEDRAAPLYNRTTDEIDLGHLDIASLVTLLEAHSALSAERLLFLWNLFEGVPKFYRDCYEQGVLSASREEVLRKLFFLSSSPLRTEADNWFLKELHGRYDVILKFIAKHQGCMHGELIEHVRQVSTETSEQVGGYLKILIERYGLIDRKLPIFAKQKERKSRYYIADNFLRAWLGALASPASALNFRPIHEIIAKADERLMDLEGFALEKISRQLYEERARKGVSDFPLTQQIEGYWDRGDTEIDLVAISENTSRIRFASCKRDPSQLAPTANILKGHVQRFLDSFPEFAGWDQTLMAIAPSIPDTEVEPIRARGLVPESLEDLIAPFRSASR